MGAVWSLWSRKSVRIALVAELVLAASCVQLNASDSSKTESSRTTTSSGSPQPAVTPLPVGGSLLVEADLMPTPNHIKGSKNQSELEKVLNMGRVFYANQPETELKVPPGFEGCYAELDTFTMDANKVSAKMVKTLDISKCVSLATDQGIRINSVNATLEIYLYMSCSVGDLSGLQGKPFREMSTNLIAKSGCEEGTLHLEFLSSTTASAVYPGDIATSFKRRTVSLDGTSQLKGCKFKVKDKVETRDNDCINYAKDDYSFDIAGMTRSFSDLYKFQFQDVASDYNSPDNIWRSKGRIQLSVNNWTGSVSFNGATESPAYEASDEVADTDVSGRLTATPAGGDMFVPATLMSDVDPTTLF